LTQAPTKRHIPGFASYFWMLPTEGIFATVRLGQHPTARIAMEKYLKAYLTGIGEHVVLSDNDTVLGYRADEESPLREKVHPRVRSSLAQDQEQADFLRENRERIRHVINRQELQVTTRVNENLARQLLVLAGVMEAKHLAATVPLRYDIAYTPSKGELEEMMSSAHEQDAGREGVGFMLEGDDRIYWLRDVHLRLKLDIGIASPASGVYPARSLLKQLNKQQEHVIGRAKPRAIRK
jgi:hypothetical protein